MNRALAATLAALVVATGVAGGVLDQELDRPAPTTGNDANGLDGATASAASSADQDYMAGSERTRRLELSGDARSSSLSSSWNLGTRIAASDDAMETRYATATFENRVGADFPEDRREAAITDRLQRIEERIVTLRAAERNAVAAYARGDGRQDNVTAALVRSHTEAKALERTLARLERLSATESNENFADNLQFRLNTFQSPLREQLAASTRGAEDPTRLSLRTSETGYVLGAIVDGTYYREALRYDNRRPSGPKAISSASDLETRQSELYDDTSPPGVQRFYKASGAWVGRMVYTYSDTEIQAFFDGGTGDVFYERTSYTVADMERTETINATNESVRLVVERTFFDGPIRVTAVDAETGDPIDTTVLVDGDPVGSTGADGTLWLLEPDAPYTVSVTDDGTTVEETVGGT